ncbi:MAG: SRPBCC family protein [Bacteroidota bacterium]
MIIEKEIIIDKGIEEAWEVLGVQFTQVYKWASSVNQSEGFGQDFNGASCTERGCDTSLGGLKEKLIHFSPTDHSLSYNVTSGLPNMLKKANNNWRLERIDARQTKLLMKLNLTLRGLATVLYPFVKRQMSRFTQQLVEEFKYYVEKGEPHPRKQKAMQQVA